MAGIFANFLDKLKFNDSAAEEKAQSNQFASDHSDGAVEVEENFTNFMLSIDWQYSSQAEIIERYREISNYQEVDYAVEDITNEMVSFSEDEAPIRINLENIDDKILSKNIKKSIYAKWDKIASILELNDTVHRRARQFYIDGRLSYHKVIDKNKPADGLLNIVELDSRYVTKIRNIEYDKHDRTINSVSEKFIYDENLGKKKGGDNSDVRSKDALEIHPDALTYVTSGLIDPVTGFSIGWLHKAVKPANQLRLMENALLIYRITRAPERRVFNVSTGGLPKNKAEQYLRNLMSNYRNRMSYNPDSGSFKDDRHLMTMQEDFWFAKDASGKGTEVDTLPGGQSLGETADIEYFLRRLYKALNEPLSRLDDSSTMSFGRQSEIGRDELKFSKFVSKLRKRFNMMFLDLLKTELILTKVITIKEWNSIKESIEFRYAQDMYLEEQKKHELLRDRLELANELAPYVGKYFSHDYIQKDVFNMTEEELNTQRELIEKEKSDIRFKQDENDF